jgi:hypothetical protein
LHSLLLAGLPGAPKILNFAHLTARNHGRSSFLAILRESSLSGAARALDVAPGRQLVHKAGCADGA